MNDKRWAIVVDLKARLAVDKRLELLHSIEDCLDTHPEALSVLMELGNYILAEVCFRMRHFLPKANRLLFVRNQILRKNLKSGWLSMLCFRVHSDVPSRLHHHLALTRPGEVMVKVGGRTLLSSRIRAHSLN